MERRQFFLVLVSAIPALAADPDSTNTVRGKLVPGPALRTPQGKLIRLKGDAPTIGVLTDQRLANVDFEAAGHLTAPDEFTIDPIQHRALFVYRDGKKLMVTYWCDVCAIRTYTPGKCWCCQEETALDLIDPDKVDKK